MRRGGGHEVGEQQPGQGQQQVPLPSDAVSQPAQAQGAQQEAWIWSSASKSSIRRFVITEKAPTRAFSWLKAATNAFTFKTLLRHYAKQALTPWSLHVKLGLRLNQEKALVGAFSVITNLQVAFV